MSGRLKRPGSRLGRLSLGLLTLGLNLNTAGGAAGPATPAPLSARATLRDPAGAVSGEAQFTQQGDGVRVDLTVSGLTPGMHGMHVHDLGRCTPGVDPATNTTVPFGGAGGHFDPGMTMNHDAPTASNRAGHGGDLPMVMVGADGSGQASFFTSKISLSGMNGVLNRALIVHALPDDYKSDPAGGTGARERCGLILRAVATRDYPLPGPQDFPEGVTYHPGKGVLLTGSARTGDIYAVNPQSGAVSIFSKGGALGRSSALGLKVDRQGRVWVAGGATGAVSVLSPDGAPVATVMTPPSPDPYLNDLAIAPGGGVYVTDSTRPVLWYIGADFRAMPWLDLTHTPIRYGPGINLNGIVLTPDNRSLLTIQLNTGDLWRIDLRSKAVKRVASGLTRGDGLLLDGHTLYVARNAEQVVAKVQLSADYGSGQLVAQEPLNGLRFPSTLASLGSDLIVVQSQLNKLQGGVPETPFRLTRFPRF